MTPRRLAMLRVTPEALAAALRLAPGIRVYRVHEETEFANPPADILVVVEDTTGERLPAVAEGQRLLVVNPERATLLEGEPA